MSVATYFRGPETLRRRELVYGVVWEPPAPYYSHQQIVTNLTAALHRHVQRYGLGRVCVSPVDVVLDRQKALVVQPDIIFVSNERQSILRDRVWGAPDLAVEIFSFGTTRHNRTVKLEWYRRYGVRECWLVNPIARQVDVIPMNPNRPRRVYQRSQQVRSTVLPRLRLRAAEVFDASRFTSRR